MRLIGTSVYSIFNAKRALCLAQCVLCCMFSVFSVEYIFIWIVWCARLCYPLCFLYKNITSKLAYWIGRWCKSVDSSFGHSKKKSSSTKPYANLCSSDQIAFRRPIELLCIFIFVSLRPVLVLICLHFFFGFVVRSCLPKETNCKTNQIIIIFIATEQRKEKKIKNHFSHKGWSQEKKKSKVQTKIKTKNISISTGYDDFCDAKRCVFSKFNIQYS